MSTAPLADRLRPENISQIVGQEHILSNNGFITKLLENYKKSDFFPSIIFWGPPGCGKTTLARCIAKEINRPFLEFSAVNASVKEIEKAVPKTDAGGQKLLITVKAPIVFIDEIHRFNKAQQDALLPQVEQGKIILIGATTENPSFEVIAPLLSRSKVIVLNQLDLGDLKQIIKSALTKMHRDISTDALDILAEASNGDARNCLNSLEIAAQLTEINTIIAKETVTQALQKSLLYFDLKGEEFYNTISALHKSIRGSDPNAALYWLARILEAGQDPLYVARRLIRTATEDIGIADPTALSLATACFNACNMLGMPECNLALAETVVYLAKSPKSNKIYLAYQKAAKDAHDHANLPVPLHIRNAPTKLMKELGYGKGYDYTHNKQGQKNPNIKYFPDKMPETDYLKLGV